MSRHVFEPAPLPTVLVSAIAFMVLTPTRCHRTTFSGHQEEQGLQLELDEAAHFSFTNSSLSHRSDVDCGGLMLGDSNYPEEDEAKANCLTCIQKVNQCKWCPLSQTCTKRGKPACTKREWTHEGEDALSEDSSIKVKKNAELHEVTEAEARCRDSSSSWRRWMTAVYGEIWERDKAHKARHMDTIRCSQWALDWPVTLDNNMKLNSDDVVGQWACISALMRETLVWILNHEESPQKGEPEEGIVPSAEVEEEPNRTEELPEGVANDIVAEGGGGGGVLLEKDSRADLETDPWKKELRGNSTGEPQICELIRLKTKYCEVDIFGSREFEQLRKLELSPNGKGPDSHSLRASISAGPLVAFDPGAGKSGSGFARTWDSRFFFKFDLKDGSAADAWMDEPDNLKKLVSGQKGKAPTLMEHLTNHKESLLNRYVGLLSYKIGKEKPSYVLIMQDATYGFDKTVQDLKKTRSDLKFTRYDLKGGSRDPDLKQDKNKTFTLVNGDFKQNEAEKMHVSPRHCTAFHHALRADLDFLQAHRMIDYSIFLTVAKAVGSAPPPNCSQTPGMPFCIQDGSFTYTVALIDYTNDYSKVKRLEGGFKGRFSDYDKQIMDFAMNICSEEEKSMSRVGVFIIIGGAVTLITICLSVWCFCVPTRNKSEPVPPDPRYGGPQSPNSGYPQPPVFGGVQQPPGGYEPGPFSSAPTWGVSSPWQQQQ